MFELLSYFVYDEKDVEMCVKIGYSELIVFHAIILFEFNRTYIVSGAPGYPLKQFSNLPLFYPSTTSS